MWRRAWMFVKRLPSLVWVGVGAVGAFAVALVSARKRGERVGAANAEARVETRHIDALVENAKKSAQLARLDRTDAATRRAQDEAERLREDVMRRVRK